jgi:hypothetical protein
MKASPNSSLESAPACGGRARRAALSGLATLIALGALAAPSAASIPAARVELGKGVFTTPRRLLPVDAVPGSNVIAFTLDLSNPSRRPVPVRLEPLRALGAGHLGVRYTPAPRPPPGPAGWLTLPGGRVLVPPRSTGAIPIYVETPPEATGGDRVVGIAVTAGGRPRARAARAVVGVQLRLPAPRVPNLTIDGVRASSAHGYVSLLLLATNRGNTVLGHVHGQATVTQGDRVLGTRAIGPGIALPHEQVAIPIARVPAATAASGGYRVVAQLLYGHSAATLDRVVSPPRPAPAPAEPSSEPSVGQRPSTIIALGALVVLLTALAVVQRRRRTLLSRPATMAAVERLLAKRGEGELSAIHIVLKEPSKRNNRRVANAIKRGLRSRDLVGDLWQRGLIVMLPHTGHVAAEERRGELQRILGDSDAAPLVKSMATDGATGAEGGEELLKWLRAAGLGYLRRSGVQVGSPQGMGATQPSVAPQPAPAPGQLHDDDRVALERANTVMRDMRGALDAAAGGYRSDGAWLLAALVPTYPGELAVDSGGIRQTQEWAWREQLSREPADGFFDAAPVVRADADRYELSASQGEAPAGARSLHVYGDGTACAARALHERDVGYPPDPRLQGAVTILEDKLISELLLALRASAKSAARAGCWGGALIHVRLEGSAMYLAREQDGLVARVADARRVDLASSRHVLSLDALAGDGNDFRLEAQPILADLLGAFTLAQPPRADPHAPGAIPGALTHT